ncbi:hypothetical protein BDN70DRAFT_872870 [Pholiota conissans]|uniref:Uncharacterized protein n=1 Tax=Pholiota conissans TaxID=109636 RepID=A0A9P5ZB04_9AGAR|nr:hypothetical protein BDN70DRAFT_872870 [Pholiota conissans]
MAYPGQPNSAFMSPQIAASGSRSLAEAFRCQSKIADFTYRLSSLSNLPSVLIELLHFMQSDNNHFIDYQTEIIMLIELARKKLESAGVVPYLWASCPQKFVTHKTAYVDLLRLLQSNEQYVDTKLQKRLRVLLMPLTSTFTMSPDLDIQTSRGSPSKASGARAPPHAGGYTHQVPQYLSSSAQIDSSSMPPPDAFPVTDSQPQDLPPAQNPGEQRIWHSSELRGAYSERRARSRSPHPRNDANADIDQENVAPTSVPFQQPPTRQRFGIFLTGKSSMLGGYKRKDRAGRPTH